MWTFKWSGVGWVEELMQPTLVTPLSDVIYFAWRDTTALQYLSTCTCNLYLRHQRQTCASLSHSHSHSHTLTHTHRTMHTIQ